MHKDHEVRKVEFPTFDTKMSGPEMLTYTFTRYQGGSIQTCSSKLTGDNLKKGDALHIFAILGLFEPHI